jgi:hypothetical protein
MKRKIIPLFVVLPILVGLFSLSFSSSPIKAKAVDVPWVEVATPQAMGEDFAYTINFNQASIATANPFFPSIPNTNATETTFSYGITMLSTNTYIGSSDDFLTLDTWAMIQGQHNLGRIDVITIDIDESHYSNIQTELAGAFGLQLREGRVNEFQNAEDEESGPTYIDLVNGIVAWDLTIRGRTHPFFLDESRLDDISNFNFIATRTIYLDGITVTGHHFMEITNGTSLRPAYAAYEGFSTNLFDINMDNRVDFALDDFNVTGFSSETPRPLADMLEFSISYAYPYDGTNYLTVSTMKAIIMPDEFVFEIVPLFDEVVMQIDKKNWLGDIASITYGDQDASILDESVFTINFPALGYQELEIGLWNAYTYVPGQVTNNGAIISVQEVGVTGEIINGSIMSSMVDGSSYTSSDVIDPVTPQNSYSIFRLDDVGSGISLSSTYQSQGYVDSMDFTLTIHSYEAFSGTGESNRFTLAFHQHDGQIIDETVRSFTLTPSDTTKTISYTNQSGYLGASFSLYCDDIFDYRFNFSLSVNGFEYYPNVITPEQQALLFARSFDIITSNLQGGLEDGVCEFDIHNDWAKLIEEYDVMHTNTKTVLSSNSTTMKSPEVEAMIERYQYIRSTNPSYYVDFLGLSSAPGEMNTSITTNARLPLFIVVALLSIGGYYFFYQKQKRLVK